MLPAYEKKINKLLTIAIDGYSGCGKSSTAKAIAKELNYNYIDTGAMYRAVTLHFLTQKLDFSSDDVVKNEIKKISLNYSQKKGHAFQLILNSQPVDSSLREPAINKNVGQIASSKIVRNYLLALQQRWGAKGGVILDGRDIGTHVFPNAEVKIFMIAQLEKRAERRFNELKEQNIKVSFEEVKDNLVYRDKVDSSRAASPLVRARDAILIDTTCLSFDEQVSQILQIIYQKKNFNHQTG